jgi:two-component system sensor histidine kinase TctE
MHRMNDGAGRRSRPLGLSSRLIAWLAIPLLCILIGSTAIAYHTAGRIADQTQDQALADSLFDLASHVKAQGDGRPLDLGEEASAILRSNAPDVLFYAVRDAAGGLLIGDAELPAAALRPHALDEPAFSDAVYQGRPVRVAVLRAKTPAQELQITVAQTTLRRQQAQRQLLAAMVVPLLAVMAATLLAVLFGVRRGLLPLLEVEAEIASRSASDLRPFDPDHSPAEIRPMLRRLNELFQMLEQAAHLQQRFIADAAHQLKTPLAGLRNQVDLAIGDRAALLDQAWLGRVDQATSRIGHLLNQLLAYARAEATDADSGANTGVALDELAEASASDFLDAALLKQIDLGFDIAPATVQGVRWMLKEALANLVDNAIRYSPPGGVVTVRCGCDPSSRRPFLEVQDSGPGIPAEQRSLVFERFYRIPGTAGDGCGLGLPIVQEIARRHGADVGLHAVATGGLRVRIDFPVAGAIRATPLPAH